MARVKDSLGNYRGIIEKYEIPTNISVDYMKYWGMSEAFRELIQNALDEMTEIKKLYGKWYIVVPPEPVVGNSLDISGDLGIVNLPNKTIVFDRGRGLSVRALIMGESIKKVPSRGRFGEGLKLASLIIARSGFKMSIETKDLVIRPYIKTTTIGGETFYLLSFKVYKAVADKWDFGTVISISPPHGSTPYRVNLKHYIPVDALVALATIMKTTNAKSYDVVNEIINKDPESWKPLLFIKDDSIDVCFDTGKEGEGSTRGCENIGYVWVPNMVLEEPRPGIYYRDILITRRLKYMFSYNLWRTISPHDLSRDRTYINKSWLDRTIGSIWEATSSKEMIRRMINEIVNGSAAAKVYEEFNSLIFYISHKRVNTWKQIWGRIAGKKAVLAKATTIQSAISLLNYHGFTVYIIPGNLSGIFEILPNVNTAIRQLEKERKLYKRLKDEEIPSNALKNLNDIRKLHDWIYKRIHVLSKEFTDHGLPFESMAKPGIYAYDYPSLAARNRVIYGHTDYTNNEIGISVNILRASLIRSVAVYVHELAHYLTDCDDGTSCHHRAMEIIAGMLGEVVIMMINKLMM